MAVCIDFLVGFASTPLLAAEICSEEWEGDFFRRARNKLEDIAESHKGNKRPVNQSYDVQLLLPFDEEYLPINIQIERIVEEVDRKIDDLRKGNLTIVRNTFSPGRCNCCRRIFSGV